MKRLTFISDTHNKHRQLTLDLDHGGDFLFHTGDISSMGYNHEIIDFCKWFNSLDRFAHKVFIAGNHDFGFQERPDEIKEILKSFPKITYLQDSFIELDGVKIYGSPWQPRFHNWAFNADPGEDIQQHWNKIPNGLDVLLTHGPVFGMLDDVDRNRGVHLGCVDLYNTILKVQPKIHCCGHIHTGYGFKDVPNSRTIFINASSLNERYVYAHKPISIGLD